LSEFTWALQGSTPTTIGETDIIQFAGDGGFNSKVTVDEYNDSTHVKSSGGDNDSNGNTPNNVKFVSQTGGTGGDSQADWGDGTEDLDQITNGEATLKITFADAAEIETEDAILYAYNGVTPATPPVGVDVRAAEVGDANWTQAEGSGAALQLDHNNTPATSHDFYIPVSVSPTSVGLKSFAFRIELTFF
jgi:hypothetical protein